jgi:hypothetical protein
MSALPPILPIFRAEDASGASLPFALLYTYAAGTTTPLATYQDAAGTIPNSNPVVCDANGLAVVYTTAGVGYKFVLTDQFGTVQPRYPVDGITGGAQGLPGAAGSTWRSGSGVPLDSIGANGDFYLDTNTGDIYAKSTGAYGLVMNIKGPPGSSVNVIKNGSFYKGLMPWNSLPSDAAAGVTPTAPVIGAGHTAASSAAQLLCPSTDFAVAKIYRGSVSQGFSIPVPQGTSILTFWTTCYLETVTAQVSNTGYIKAYLFSQTAGTETLLQTYTLTATSATPTWTQQSLDLTASLPAQGDYGIRFEIESACNNVSGSGANKGTITAIDDITLLVTAAGTTGPAGATGPAGPAGPAGTATYLRRTTLTSNATYTTAPNTQWLDVTCTAGGGAGAGHGVTVAGGGGGAGGTIRKRIAVTGSTGYAVVIGPGGIGGVVGASGSDGTATTFGGTLVVASPGKGGSATGVGGAGGAVDTFAGGPGGAAGTSSVAPVGGASTSTHVTVFTFAALPGGGGGGGGNKNAPIPSNAGAGGGGTEAFSGGIAGDTELANQNGGGGGGASAWADGGRGASAFDAADAGSGSQGSGGGGGCAFYGTGAGANGGAGLCIIEEIA